MDFGFSEEQEHLRSETRKFLDTTCPLAEVRKVTEEQDGFSPELWKQIAELGWLGLTIPEEHGGVGLGWVDLTVLLEETGRSLFPLPFLSHTLAANTVLRAGSVEQQAAWLPRFSDGSLVGTVAILEASDCLDPEAIQLSARADGNALILSGEKRFVPDGAAASVFVVAFRAEDGGGICFALVERDTPGVRVESLPGMDLTKPTGRLFLDEVRVPGAAILRERDDAFPFLLDCGAMAVTAEMVGAAEAALDLTVRYGQEREQFDSRIGRFQGVKHPLAEMYVDIESFKSLTYYAAWTLDREHPDLPRAVSRAKAYASEAFARIGIDCVQLHGGVGYTWEYDIHLYLKRAKWSRNSFGDADWHYERLARLGGLGGL